MGRDEAAQYIRLGPIWIARVFSIAQAIGLLVSGLYFVVKTNAALADLREIRARVERVEKYLSSRDPMYWQTVKQMEEKP